MKRLIALGLAAVFSSVAMAGGEDEVAIKPVSHAKVKSFAQSKSSYAPISAAHTRGALDGLVNSVELNKWVNEITDLAIASSGKIRKDDVSVTYIELSDSVCSPALLGDVNGEEMRYASGIANLYYAATFLKHKGKSAGNLSTNDKNYLYSALHNGSLAAANQIVEGVRANGGVSAVNKFFNSIGFTKFNVKQRFMTGDPTDEDLRLLGRKLNVNYENSNRVTSNQTAAAFYLLSQNALVSPGVSADLKELMFHPLEQKQNGPLQGIAAGLPIGSKIITVNGYTVRNYHETALVHLPNGKSYILSIMTGYEGYPTIFIPQVSRIIANRVMTKTGSDDPAVHYQLSKAVR